MLGFASSLLRRSPALAIATALLLIATPLVPTSSRAETPPQETSHAEAPRQETSHAEAPQQETSHAEAPRQETSRAAASRPDSFQRACGSIDVGARRLRVDIDDGDGTLVTCAQARRVGLRFVRDHHRRFHVGGRRWECYRSRADGVGWANHCSTSSERYVDVGIGRRW